jgi:hypothetical protein
LGARSSDPAQDLIEHPAIERAMLIALSKRQGKR